jgi:predicted phage terminase large subunit-like protein
MMNSTKLKELLASLPSIEAIQTERLRRSIKRAEEKEQKVAGRMSLVEFIRAAWRIIIPEQEYVHGWHIDFIAAHLEAITYGRLLAKGLQNRLLINIPPGTMKSLLVSVFWPAWEWGPAGLNHFQYLATSFREEFCRRDSMRFTKIITSEWFQRHWPVGIVKQTEMHVENARGGWRAAVPFGSLTGGRADRLLIDDPHSVEKAESDLDRARTTIRFRESATSRLNDPKTSAIIVIMQRLQQHDISGTILQLHLPYIHIMLPMRFEPDRRCETILGLDPRKDEGELLFSDRFPLEVVDRDEKAMGVVATAGQQQQRPTPRGGLTFKRWWFGIVKAAPAGTQWVRGWDLAASEERSSAFTAGALLGWHEGERRFYIADVVRDRVENPERLIVTTAQQDGTLVEVSLPQDPGSAGKIQARSLVAALAGFTAYATPESGDKVQRALPAAAQAEAGNVLLVEGAWNSDFLDEVETFPTGYKDQIDAFSRAFGRFVMRSGGRMLRPTVGEVPERGFLGDNLTGGEPTRNPALGDGVGTSGNGGGTGLEHLGIR